MRIRHLATLPVVLVMFALLFGAAACSNSEPESGSSSGSEASAMDAFAEYEGTIDIAGGTAHIPVMEAVAADIMAANSKITITVAGGGSGVGAQQAGEGLVDIGNTGRELKEEELAAYPDLVSFSFAVDGVAAIVHPDNGVSALTSEQLQDIFSGKISNWSEVGGADADINVYSRDEASGTREVFWEKGLAEGEIVADANIVASNGAMKTAVAGDPQAIGYMGIGGIDESVAGLQIDGVEPTQENAKSGAYSVTRLLLMNTKGEPTGLTKAFIDFIMGEDAVPYIEEAGYIPLL